MSRDSSDNPRHWDEQLLTAIRHEFSYAFNQLISKEVDVNKPYDGFPLLMHAINFGNLEDVSILLDKGADINWKDVNGNSALLKAATMKNFRMVEFLLEKGANADISGPDGQSLIHLCLESPQALEKALERIPNPDLKDDFGYTPIFRAAASFQTLAIELLAKFGADVNFNAVGGIPLTHAVRHSEGRLDAVYCLLAVGADVNHKDGNNSTALHYAETAGMIGLLVKGGAEVNVKDNFGNTALHYLAQQKSPDPYAVERLIEHGADIDAKNNRGDTPLMWFVRGNSPERLRIVDYLLLGGADASLMNNSLKSVLYYACHKGSIQMVSRLHAAGARADFQPSFSQLESYQTPLHAACISESSEQEVLEVIWYLLEVVRVDVNQVFGLDETAIHYACRRKSSSALKLLTDQGRYDAKLEAPDGEGRRPIHLAAGWRSDCFQHLINLGCDVHVTDDMGRNALHWAAVSNNVDAVRRILDMPNLAIDKRDVNGWTALCLAAFERPLFGERPLYTGDTQAETVALLLDKGADKSVQVLSPEGKIWTPLTIAEIYNAVDE
ncbi:hypothetical protein Trihar35433_5491 [Trichoderma harzianum]|nr:hypothetical protein Trihar35433_5491 [Trichoderma harzianum]